MIFDSLKSCILLKPRIKIDQSGSLHLVDDETSPEKIRLITALKLIFDDVNDYSSSNFMPFGGPGSGNIVMFGGQVNVDLIVSNMIKGLISRHGELPFFPLDSKIGEYILQSDKPSPSKTLAALAAAGVHTCLPNITASNPDIILNIKDKYNSERLAYLHHFSTHISTAHQSVQQGAFKDAWEYATYTTNPEIEKALNQYTRAIKNGDSKLLKSIAFGTLSNTPTICSAIATSGLASILPILFQILLSKFSESRKEKLAEFGLPHISYIYKLREDLS